MIVAISSQLDSESQLHSSSNSFLIDFKVFSDYLTAARISVRLVAERLFFFKWRSSSCSCFFKNYANIVVAYSVDHQERLSPRFKYLRLLILLEHRAYKSYSPSCELPNRLNQRLVRFYSWAFYNIWQVIWTSASLTYSDVLFISLIVKSYKFYVFCAIFSSSD
mgnify:CR=1 FL=1